MINQVTLVGRLTRDPELKVTPDGIYVTHITLAVNRHFKNQSGQFEADFIQCTLWRKTAENTAQYCRKGFLIGITGRIQTRTYENLEGRKVYVTEVIAETVQFLGKKITNAQEQTEEKSYERTQVQTRAEIHEQTQEQTRAQTKEQTQAQARAQTNEQGQAQARAQTNEQGQAQNQMRTQSQSQMQTQESAPPKMPAAEERQATTIG